MNDFTKEELQFILNYMFGGSYRISTKDKELFRDKLQSMIDNYCEHESDGYCYYKSGIKCTDFLTIACSESPCLLKCKKCSELYDDGRP